jgi:hypothetical protein
MQDGVARLHSKRRHVLTYVRSIGVQDAYAFGQNFEGWEFVVAIFTAVFGLLGSFIEYVPAPVWTVGMTHAVTANEAVDAGSFVPAVFAIAVRHGGA